MKAITRMIVIPQSLSSGLLNLSKVLIVLISLKPTSLSISVKTNGSS